MTIFCSNTNWHIFRILIKSYSIILLTFNSLLIIEIFKKTIMRIYLLYYFTYEILNINCLSVNKLVYYKKEF